MKKLLKQRILQTATGIAAAIVLLANASIGQEPASQKTDSVRIKNFGQVDDRFFRGAQPKAEDYKDLKALGIRTVIDLTDDPKPYSKAQVESLGMQYIHIPMIAKKYPTAVATDTFLKTVRDPNTGKFYLHCAGGRHRTGAMGAVYRYEFYDWDFDKVYKEMKLYDFYTSWGHGAFKDFVKDYYERKQAGSTQAISDSTSTPQSPKQ